MSQNHFSPETVIITNRSVSDSSDFHSLFSMLSVNNEKNINKLYLELSYQQSVENTGQGVKISWSNVSLSGSTFFRDFDFDTLLTPDRALVTLTWPSRYNNQTLTQQFRVPFPKTNLLFTLRGYEGKGVTVQVDFDISKAKYQRFSAAAGIANHYYGFYSVLSNILKNKTNHEADDVILKYLEVHRALYRIEKLHLVSVLPIKNRDPKKLLPLLAKAGRLETRERTLSMHWMDKDATNNEAEHTAKKISGLSVRYLTYESNYQPYLAASYRQMARLVHDDKTDAFYNKLCNSFTPNKRTDISLCQRVFDELLSQANLYKKAEQYTSAMIMVDNAALWSQMTPGVIEEPAFSEQLNGVLDGMMTSYLRVAAASYRAGNRTMGVRYILKADNLYKTTARNYRGKVSNFLPLFQSTLIQFAKYEVENNSYQVISDLFYRFQHLAFTPQEKKDILKLKSPAYQKLYRRYIRSAQTALNNGYLDEALLRMQTVKSFRELRAEFVNGDEQAAKMIEKVAYGLILEFIQRGEILMDNGKHDEAMDNFSTALELQNDFLSYRIGRLDELMSQTAVPVILHNIEKAKLEVWANNMDAAQNSYQKIVAFQHKYFLEQNSEVSNKVAELKAMLGNRGCVDAGYSLKNYLEVLQNRIRLKKWSEAAQTMKKAEKLIGSHRSCKLDTLMITGLQYRYRFAFTYIEKYEKVKAKLYAYGYNEVWEQLAGLDAYYVNHKLDLLGVTPTGQYQILKTQQNRNSVQRVVYYYLSKDNSLQAFRYLLLLKEFGLTAREAKALQVEVGRKMGAQLSFEKFSNVVDENSRWLQPLIKTYHSLNR